MKTVSLELAKQLKEAGYSQESRYAYYIDKDESYLWEKEIYIETSGRQVVDSPTADEILDQLPDFIRVLKSDGYYYIEYAWDKKYTDRHYETEKNIVEGLAKMWLYLKKEGLII